MVEGKGLVDSAEPSEAQQQSVPVSKRTAPKVQEKVAGEGRSERRVRLSLDVEIDEIDR